MKKRITKIWGFGVIVMLLASLMVIAAPASATDNAFQMELTPGPPTYAVPVVSGDVADFTVYGDGATIWAVTGTDNYTYKTDNGGAVWVRGNTTVFSDMTPDLIAVAPDNGNVIAVCDKSTLKLRLTKNGGVTWSDLGTIQEGAGDTCDTITDIAISPTWFGTNFVAVSGDDDAGDGNLWYFDVGAAAPVWRETKDHAGFNGVAAGNNFATSVDTVAFSPNFPSDLVMVAVTSNGTAQVMYEIFSFTGDTAVRAWNEDAAFPSQYPVTVVADMGGATVTSASIALDPEYLGSDDIMRNAFIGLALASDATQSGVYRCKDTLKESVKTGVFINSVTYDGTTLVAGTYTAADGTASTTVWRSSDPMASQPTTVPSSSLKSPGGENKVIVAWAGTNLYAGTSGDESAFAVSRNSGKSFNDLSLIDTAQTNSQDVAVSADGSRAYWVTDDGNDMSVWRKDGGWERVLSVQSTNINAYIVRMAPDDPDAVYVAETGGAVVYYTKDGGQEKWFKRSCTAPPPFIQDLAVESADVAYALTGGGDVVNTTNSGFTWGPPTATKLASGYSLTCVSDGVLLAGSANGYVSYSTDGNMSWSDIKKPVEASAGNVIVAADSDYANNNTIYAARDVVSSNIMRWVIGSSTDWDDILGPSTALGASEKAHGIACQDGTLYVLTVTETVGATDNQSTLMQCLSPRFASKTSPSWSEESTTTSTDSVNTSVYLGINSASPNALKFSAGSNVAWMCKTNGMNSLYYYIDVLSTVGPTLKSPAEGFSDPVNTVTGYANEIAFSWDRLSNADQWTLYLAYDEAFTELVTFASFTADTPTIVKSIGPFKDTEDGPPSFTDGDQKINFMPGTTYYWRVKANNPLSSQYSDTRSFSIEPGGAVVPTIGAPENGATNVSATPSFSWSPVSAATKYEFQMAADTAFTSPLVSVKLSTTGIKPVVSLEEGETYFWRVKALEPVEGGWSTIANFTVAVPEAPAEPIVIPPAEAPVVNIPPIEVPAPVVEIQPAPTQPAISEGLLLAIIIIGAVLVIALIVLIVRTRRAV